MNAATIKTGILPKNSPKAQRHVADISSMRLQNPFRHAICLLSMPMVWVLMASAVQAAPLPASSISYATRIDSVQWSFSGSKFVCQISHYIDDFGVAMFERKAGENTRFYLQSQSPRMQTGAAELISQPPSWITNKLAIRLAMVSVEHGVNPVTVERKISERMLAELQKGMDILVVRQPWYGDDASLSVTVPSVGFHKTHSDYLQCLGGLLPVNFSQVEKKSLYYSNGEKKLKSAVMRYLDKVAAYVKEDPAIKAIYIDGHTDSEGVRNENLLKSKQRAERVRDYLLNHGVSKELLVMRWHGERYQVASNQNDKGRAKNRRVTIRLSKQQPVKQAMAQPQETAGQTNTVDAPVQTQQTENTPAPNETKAQDQQEKPQ